MSQFRYFTVNLLMDILLPCFVEYITELIVAAKYIYLFWFIFFTCFVCGT